MRWSRCWWSTLVPSAAPLPDETTQTWRPPAASMGGHASASPPAPVHGFHLPVVGMVRHAIQQVNDSVWIQIQGRRLLPQPLAAGLVGPHKLGLHQLTGEQKNQLALLQCGKAQVSRSPLQAPAPRPGTGTERAGTG